MISSAFGLLYSVYQTQCSDTGGAGLMVAHSQAWKIASTDECLGILFQNMCLHLGSGIWQYESPIEHGMRWVREIAPCRWGDSTLHIIARERDALLFCVLIQGWVQQKWRKVIITWMSLKYAITKWLAVTERGDKWWPVHDLIDK